MFIDEFELERFKTATMTFKQGCICRGVGEVEPPRKFLTPPAAIKKTQGGCISTVVDFSSQNFDPPYEI